MLSPGKAVIWAAFFNFVAAFTFGTAVAQDRRLRAWSIINVVTFAVIFAGLLGAIVWDLITWYFGLPTSSSHALIGGYAGAAVAKAGLRRDHPGGLDQDAHLHRPRAAHRPGRSGFVMMIGDLLDLPADAAGARRPAGSAGCSCVSAAGFSLEHGANDAQKTMGIIAGVLFAGGYISMVNGICRFRSGSMLAAHAAIASARCPAAGASSTRWGRRSPSCSRSAASPRRPARAVALFTATHFGVRVSTTHTITGAIVGVGATRRLSAVRWGVAGRIVWAWVLTIPAAAAIAARHLLDHRRDGRAVALGS